MGQVSRLDCQIVTKLQILKKELRIELMKKFTIIGKVFFGAEYVAAVDHFEMGELSFDSGTEELKPKAWNMEVAVEVTEDLEIRLRFEGSDDCVDFLPEMQYGVIVSYGLFKNTGLAVEYLNGKFKNDDKQDVITAQLSVEF